MFINLILICRDDLTKLTLWNYIYTALEVGWLKINNVNIFQYMTI
jgi:hypothetical protein